MSMPPSALRIKPLATGGFVLAVLFASSAARAKPPCAKDPVNPNAWRGLVLHDGPYSLNDKGLWYACEPPGTIQPDIIVTARRKPKAAQGETSVERAYREQEERLKAQWDAYRARIGQTPPGSIQDHVQTPHTPEPLKSETPDQATITPDEMKGMIVANGGALAVIPDADKAAPAVLSVSPQDASFFSAAKREPKESPEAREEAAKQKALERASRAGAKAAGLASGINIDKGDAGTTSGAAGATGGDPGGGAKNGDGAASELLLAQSSGLTQPFKDLGLKASQDASGRASIRRADGSPASPAEIAELKRRVGEEPLAQMGRPDFFMKVSRDQFGAVKDAYRSNPSLRASTLKDVGATESERDFKWTRTCNSQLDSDCNKHEPQGRYAGGKYVSPEALAKMAEEAKKAGADKSKGAAEFWAKLEKEDREYREGLAKEKAAAASAKAPKSFGGRLSALLAAVTRAMSFGGSAPEEKESAAASNGPETIEGPNGLLMTAPAKLPSDVALLKSMPPLSRDETAPPPFSWRRPALYCLLMVLAALTAAYVRRLRRPLR